MSKRPQRVVKEKRPWCRHYHSWILSGGRLEWCYECGALRKLKMLSNEPSVSAPDGPWVRPVGKNGPNPWEMFEEPRP